MARVHSRNSRAFTLIELLVVIAIIAILAAILFPVFARARENARRASCQSNMKQLGLGMMQYNQDYDEKMPNGVLTSGWGTIHLGMGWGGQLYPYTKSVQVYKCPSDSTKMVGTFAANSSVVSYAYNAGINSPNGGTETSPKALAALNSTAKTVVLFEVANSTGALATTGGEPTPPASDYNLSAAGWGYDARIWMSGNASGMWATGPLGGRTVPSADIATDPNINMNAQGGLGFYQYPYGRHLEGSNFLMADGHVKWFKGAAVSGGLNPANANDAQGAGTAEGTEYTGAGSHAVTFSPL